MKKEKELKPEEKILCYVFLILIVGAAMFTAFSFLDEAYGKPSDFCESHERMIYDIGPMFQRSYCINETHKCRVLKDKNEDYILTACEDLR